MNAARTLTVCAVAMVLSTHTLQSQQPGQYRDYTLGRDLASIAGQLHMNTSEASVIHERPALVQDLQWRTPYFAAGSNEPQRDTVQQILFSFYNNHLFKMVIDYDRQRTDGMTDADMVAAFSETYGTPVKVKPKTSSTHASQIDVESGRVIGRWGDASYSLVLSRSSFEGGFQAIVTSTALDALARTADAQAIRLDEREAPTRELARQKKEADDVRTSQERARVANKAAFKP